MTTINNKIKSLFNNFKKNKNKNKEEINLLGCEGFIGDKNVDLESTEANQPKKIMQKTLTPKK